MEPSNNNNDVQTAIQLQNKMDYGSPPDELIDMAVAEIKASAIFAHPWPQLLVSAPFAIRSTGMAFVAASPEAAAGIELDPPRGGFQYLRFNSLRANLNECGDMGAKAFLTADGGMSYIHSVASMIPNKVNDIMGLIASPSDARRMLKGALLSIKKSADNCYDRANTIDKAFTNWMLYATELHTCCVQQESSTEDKLSMTRLQVLAARSFLQADEIRVKEQKAQARLFRQQFKMASDVYKKASDNFPSGWDLMGQELIGKLGDTVITALGQLAHAYIMNMNYTARAEEAEKLFKNYRDHDEDNDSGNNNGSKTITVPKPEPKLKVPLPQDSNDPAYVQIKPAIVSLQVLYSILFKGKDGGVNWDEVTTTTANGKNSLVFVLQMLKDARQQFSEVATQQDPSRQFQEILQTSIKIANEMYKVGGNDKVKEFPGPNSTEVKEWQKGFQQVYDEANKLLAVAKTLPGSTTSETIMADLAKRTTQDPVMAQGQAVLEAAKDRLHTTQQAYTAAMSAYEASTKALSQDQKDLAKAHSKLMELQFDQKSLTAVKTVLETSIRLIAVVKQKVMDLVTFFNSISLTIEVIVEEVVEDFLRKIEENVGSDSNNPDGKLEDLKVGQYNLTDLASTQIYKSAIFMRAYFEIFGDVARMWSDVSVQSIMPGVRLLNDISASSTNLDNRKDKGELEKKVGELDNWFQQAKGDIARVVQNEQDGIMDNLNSRIKKIGADTRKLPPPTESTAVAITHGAEKVTRAAEDAIAFNAKNNPLAVWVHKK